MALIVWLMEAKNVLWLYEQPHSSLLSEHPRMQELVRARKIYRAFMWMGSYGALTPKGTHLWCPSPCVGRLSLPLPQDVDWSAELVTKKTRADGSVQITGSHALKASQAYPKQFGLATVDLWRSWQQPKPIACRNAPPPTPDVDVWQSLTRKDRWEDAQLAEVVQYLFLGVGPK